MQEERTVEISIPRSLYRNIEERIKDTGFVSVSKYVTYVLREVLAEDVDEEEPLNREEEERIRERLRSLGYLE